MLLDNFMESMAASMESNASTSTINNSHNSNSHNSNSHKGGNMETASNNSNASNSNSKGNGKRNSNSKRNGKASALKEASNSNAPTLPEILPATANAGISAKGMEQDAATSLLFQYHIRQGLAAYGGACTICQLYNYLRGDNPLRLEKDGSPKQDNLPRWRGLGSSKLFRANTQGTLLEYTNKVCANGRIRSIVKAGPMLQDFSK